VKDKPRIGITTDLCNAWTIKTPASEDYVDSLNLLQKTANQLEDVASFNSTVVRAIDPSHHDTSDNRYTSTLKLRKERKGLGPHNPKPTNPVPRSFQPPESEHAKEHKARAQTLIHHHKPLTQWSNSADQKSLPP